MKKLILIFMMMLNIVTYSNLSIYEGSFTAREIINARNSMNSIRIYSDSESTDQTGNLRENQGSLRLYRGSQI